MSPAPGLYVHVPFCPQKCPYCAFFSVPSARRVDDYVRAVAVEAAMYRPEWTEPFDTLYFGGGCPSLPSPDQFQALVTAVESAFRFTPEREFTLEANPEQVDPGRVAAWQAAGVNRLSLGAQSFDDAELAFLGRSHTVSQVRAAVALARAAGLDDLGLDLIYALPGQTDRHWLASLDAVLELDPVHLSCYQLGIEPRTLFDRKRLKGEIEPLADQRQVEMFKLTHDRLTAAGFVHYEISNFARPGFESRHNQKYWTGAPYLGLGPAAHSYRRNVRWWNPESIKEYLAALSAGLTPSVGREELTPEQVRLETIALALRTRQGLDLAAFRERFDLDLRAASAPVIEALIDDGLAVLQNDHFVPTLDGWLVADAIAAAL